jgi:hypothetical protein
MSDLSTYKKIDVHPIHEQVSYGVFDKLHSPWNVPINEDFMEALYHQVLH